MAEEAGTNDKVVLGKQLRENFSAQIMHNLALHNWSVPKFAKKLNTPKQSIYRMIRCETAATLDMVALLANGFEIEASVLLTPVKAEDRLRKGRK